MKFLLPLLLSIAAAAAVCNTKSYPAYDLDYKRNATFSNIRRKVYNKENLLKHCKDIKHGIDRQVFLNGTNREVYGRKKRGDISKLYGWAKWNNGVVPFLVEENAYSECALSSLATAMTYYEETTCVKFVSYVDKKKTPAPLLIANFVNKNGRTQAAAGQSHHTAFDGDEDIQLGFLATQEGHMQNIQTMLHELGHVLMMNHAEDSKRAVAPYSSGVNKPDTLELGPWYPFSVVTNLNNIARPHVPTDWDIWTLNAFYNCTKTTRGGKPININLQPQKQPSMKK